MWLLILARRSFHSVIVRHEKLQPEDIYHFGVFKMDKALQSLKTDFAAAKKNKNGCSLKLGSEITTLCSTNSSYPTNSNFNVFFIRSPGMKHRSGYVTL